MRPLRAFLILMFLMVRIVPAESTDKSNRQTPIDKYAQVLIRYSLDIQSGETVLIVTGLEAQDLGSAVYREALLAGGHPFLIGQFPDQEEVYYRYANENQLKYVKPAWRFLFEHFDACLFIDAPTNTGQSSGVDPGRLSISAASHKELFKIAIERTANNELKWCYTTSPTNALAREAEMSSIEYRSFVLDACKLDSPNPAARMNRQSTAICSATCPMQEQS